MGFFATFWTWLQTQLTAYIGTNTALIASAIEPVAVVLGTIYVMVWGWLQLFGQLQEPFTEGLRRIVRLAVVFGVAIRLWLYNSLLVDTFYQAPAQLGAAITGAQQPVQIIDAIWTNGGGVADLLWQQSSLLTNPDFAIAAVAVWLIIGILCVYTMFLISLATIASSMLLALGPVFVILFLFDGTRRLFEAWLAQLVNFALVTVLTTLVGSLLLQLVGSYAQQTLARGSALLTVDALDMLLVAGLVWLLLRQVTGMAAGLASGLTLSGAAALDGPWHRAGRWATGAIRGAPAAMALTREAWQRVRDSGPAEPTGGAGSADGAQPTWRDA